MAKGKASMLQGVIRLYGRMHIYKISLIVQENRKLSLVKLLRDTGCCPFQQAEFD